MNTYNFDCGCKIKIVDENIKECDGLPGLEIDFNNLNQNCQKTWDLFSTGKTKGIFQLEKGAGKTWSKKSKPTSIEDVSALTSLIRPGCVSEDTEIMVQYNGKKYITIKELYKLYKNNNIPRIISYNENTHELFTNNIENVIYSGKKECYKLILRRYAIGRKAKNKIECGYYNLKCTDDHKIYTNKGWVELKDIKVGDRIAAIKKGGSRTIAKSTIVNRHVPTAPRLTNIEGAKGFHDICYKNYEEKCVICEWNNTSLDVHHIDGDRYQNNKPENLVFLCPNHHREYNTGLLSKDSILESREKYKLQNGSKIWWLTYEGKEKVGIKDTYDITVSGPHHNFIADNIIVHNCLSAMLDNKNMAQHYVDRKNGYDDVKYIHPALESILNTTFGILTFQEQSLRIASEIAGFNLVEADKLRKAIGTKDAKLMKTIEQEFINGCIKNGLVDENTAGKIFENIKKSNKYSFNKSHAVGYSETSYCTAYAKSHFPLHFCCSYLYYASEKMFPQEEIDEILTDAKEMNIDILTPDIRYIFNGNYGDFSLQNCKINFGIRSIKGCGDKHIEKLIDIVNQAENKLCKSITNFNWLELLFFVFTNISKTVVNGVISVGGCSHFGLSRQKMLHEYVIVSELNEKEIDSIKNNIKNLSNLEDCICFIKTSGIRKSRMDKMDNLLKILKNPPFSTDDSPSWIAEKEQFYLGSAISCVKADTVNIIGNTTCKEFNNGKNDKQITIVGEIKSVREFVLKNGNLAGQKICFGTLQDSTGKIDFVLSVNKYEEYKNIVYQGNIVIITGKRGKNENIQTEKMVVAI